jgi:hypothetical protein
MDAIKIAVGTTPLFYTPAMLTPDDEPYKMKAHNLMGSVLASLICAFLAGLSLSNALHSKDHHDTLVNAAVGVAACLAVLSICWRARRDLKKLVSFIPLT